MIKSSFFLYLVILKIKQNKVIKNHHHHYYHCHYSLHYFDILFLNNICHNYKRNLLNFNYSERKYLHSLSPPQPPLESNYYKVEKISFLFIIFLHDSPQFCILNYMFYLLLHFYYYDSCADSNQYVFSFFHYFSQKMLNCYYCYLKVSYCSDILKYY